MADLSEVGEVLALIGGVLMVVSGAVHILGDILEGIADILTFGTPSVTGGGTTGAIIAIIIGLVIIMIYTDRIDLGEKLILGIVYLVLGIVASGLGGLLAILGGIFIIIDSFM